MNDLEFPCKVGGVDGGNNNERKRLSSNERDRLSRSTNDQNDFVDLDCELWANFYLYTNNCMLMRH